MSDSCLIAPTAIVHPNVQMGENVIIEDFCIIGYPPGKNKPGDVKTVIGDNTTIRSHSIIYAGVELGVGCHVGHSCFVREYTRIGDASSLGLNVIIEHHCTIGKNVRLQGQAGFCEYTVVEDDAWIGPRVVTANVPHPTCDRAKECLAGPTIRKGAILGANACISPDTVVGPGSFVGAGSVVTKDVDAKTIVFGMPAKKIGTVGKLGCKYEMLGNARPYEHLGDEVEVKPLEIEKIPLMDLAAQHQSLKQDVRIAMDTVILNARFINGKEIAAFEEQFAKFCGVEHAVGVSSGTSALELALRSLGVGAGDEVITTASTFIATIEAIAAVGAKPVLVDIDPVGYSLDPDQVEQRITEQTKAIIPVHLYGQMAPMARIMGIAKQHGLYVIEDAAQAHGASIDGKKAGQWGDLACFSFFPGKNLGAYGDAGCVVTNNEELATHVRMLRNHGRTKKHTHDILGMNHRMDTLQAAVLGVKLRKLVKWTKARVAIADFYSNEFADLPIELPTVMDNSDHVFHLYVLRIKDRDALALYLSKNKIATGIHYPIPIHLQPACAYLGYQEGDFPMTEKLANEVLSIPMYPEMTDQQQQRVANTVKRYFS